VTTTDKGPGVLRRPRGVFYGWWLAGLTAVTLALVISPIFQGIGVFFFALERDFGWSRAALSMAFSLARAAEAVIAPMAGYLTDRIGTRRLVLIGYIILGFGFILFSTVDRIGEFYLAFIVLTVGAGFASFLPLMAALNNWFIKQRATAMGIAQTGIGIGGLLVPALALGVLSLGWRTVTLVLAILMWLLALPVSAAIRNRPEEYGQRPDGSLPNTSASKNDSTIMSSPDEASVDFTPRQALRTSAFWLISIGHGLSSVVFMTLTIHVIPMMTDRGFSLPMAATIVATFTGVGGVFQVIGGLMGDRVPKRPAIAMFISLQAAGLVVLAMAQSTLSLYVFAVIFGIGFGGRVPILIALRGDYFGRKSFATIFGASLVPMNLIMMIGPVMAGYMYDVSGSYASPLLALIALNLIAVPLILLAKQPSLDGDQAPPQP
jgi:MFS family permease